MNKIISILAVAVFLVLAACNNTTKKAEVPSDTVSIGDTTTSDWHNSANSLDYEGVYKGVIPCADCEGIEVELAINKDKTYVKRTKYLGKNGKVFGDKGTFTWNKEGNTITLAGKDEGSNKYFVGENYLTQLDNDGNKITGDLADKYILKKQ